jgi:H3 lysine-79-specific histone-lysine N-methyltransferase
MLTDVSIQDIDGLCQRYLTILYQRITDKEQLQIDNKILTQTLGEITYQSVRRLISLLALTNQDVFVDMGSGRGNIAAQIFLQTDVKESIGIEIVPEYHKVATCVAHTLQNDLPEFYEGGRALTFIEGSFLEKLVPTATVVLITATCFSPELLHPLGEIINNIQSIHTVVTTRPIPNLSSFSFQKVIRIECSWDFALCYLYKRNN